MHIHIVAYREHMSALLSAQQITRASYFKVTHSYLES